MTAPYDLNCGDYEYTGDMHTDVNVIPVFEGPHMVRLHAGDRFSLGNGNETGRILVMGKNMMTIRQDALESIYHIIVLTNSPSNHASASA